MSGVKVDLATCAAAAQMSDVNIYDVDSITRRAPSLQMTADAKASRIHQMARAAE
jgi:hypothetical protein